MSATLTRLLVLVFALSYGRGVLRNLVSRNRDVLRAVLSYRCE
jgi:hypothetical protein